MIPVKYHLRAATVGTWLWGLGTIRLIEHHLSWTDAGLVALLIAWTLIIGAIYRDKKKHAKDKLKPHDGCYCRFCEYLRKQGEIK